MADPGSFLFYFNSFMLYVGWWLIPLVTIFIYKKRLSKYPIDVTIYEKRGENIVKSNDVAGRFDDPVTCYRLKMNKDTIPIVQYDWVLQCMHRPTNLLEKIVNMLAGKVGSITLFKYGSKQYKPIAVTLPNGKVVKKFKEVRDAKGQPIWINVYEPINPKQSMNKLDFEVIDWDDMNHMAQELRAIALRRSPLEGVMKYMPIIAVILAVLALIIGGYYYKEMIIDAGNKFLSAKDMGTGTPQQLPAEGNINKEPNIPIISSLAAPGT